VGLTEGAREGIAVKVIVSNSTENIKLNPGRVGIAMDWTEGAREGITVKVIASKSTENI